MTPKLAVTRSDFIDGHFGLAELLAQAVGLRVALRLAAAREQDQELLAAVAADGIILADAVLHAAGSFAQHRVAGQMPVVIVDVLK